MKIFKVIGLSFLGFHAVTVLAIDVINIENWKSHSVITKVREIYSEIQNKSKSEYKKVSIAYNITANSCATYPIKQKTIFIDKSNIVRKLVVVQIISHREPLQIERYFDKNGVLRFVSSSHVGSDTRIYLDGNGTVFWAVEKQKNNFTRTDYVNGDWETIPNNSDKALEYYNKIEGCPVKIFNLSLSLTNSSSVIVGLYI